MRELCSVTAVPPRADVGVSVFALNRTKLVHINFCYIIFELRNDGA